MDKCVMCGREIWESATYVTDGKIAVCDKCAAANSLMRVVTRVENRGYDANIKSVYVRPVVAEYSLVDQNKDGTIADESEIADDIENLSQEDFYSKYADDPAALEAFHNMNGEPAEFLKV